MNQNIFEILRYEKEQERKRKKKREHQKKMLKGKRSMGLKSNYLIK